LKFHFFSNSEKSLSPAHSSALSMPELNSENGAIKDKTKSQQAVHNTIIQASPSSYSSIHSAKYLFLYSLLLFTFGTHSTLNLHSSEIHWSFYRRYSLEQIFS